MEWQQLEYFREVARTEHYTKAAERLAISQPALSRAITKLEEELGVLLFDRLGRTVRLNQFGQAFLERVESALKEIHDGIQEINQLKDPATGQISLAFLLSLGLNILPDIIGKFNQIYPRVEFQLSQDTTPFILKHLVGGEVDLCLTSPFADQPGVAWHKLLNEEIYAYLPVNHTLATRSTIRLEELAAEPFISFKKTYNMRTLVEELCGAAGFVPLIRFEGDDITTMVGLVSSGLGVTLIPLFSGADTSKIKRLSIIEPVCQREIGLAWLEDRVLPPSVQLFRDFVIDQFK